MSFSNCNIDKYPPETGFWGYFLMLNFTEFLGEKYGPCWKGYQMVGMKKKGKKKVPNCVPMNEATYQGRKVTLNKPMKGDVKKSKVYVDPDGDGKAKKVEFGDPNMRIRKNEPARRKSFRARHNCDTAKDKSTPRYWSCKKW